MNWEVLTTAPDQLIGESWFGLIRAEGVDCKLQPSDAAGFMGVSVFPVRLIVRTGEVELAQSILDRYLAEDEEPPENYREESKETTDMLD
jgi:hypothetical protein